MTIADLQGFIFDIDGVIFRGDHLIDGARETLAALEQKNKKYIFVSNHTIYTKDQYLQKLARLGLQVHHEQLLTANDATISYIHSQTPENKRIHILGKGGIFEEFEKSGFILTDENPDWVVSSWDPEWNYEKLFKAITNVRSGAGFIITSPDRYLPTERGLEPGYGPLGASIAYATQKDPIYTGKPHAPIINEAAKRLGLGKEHIGIVGDTLETDIASKYMAGLGMAIVVLTGNTTEELVAVAPEHQKPTMIIESIKNIPEYL